MGEAAPRRAERPPRAGRAPVTVTTASAEPERPGPGGPRWPPTHAAESAALRPAAGAPLGECPGRAPRPPRPAGEAALRSSGIAARPAFLGRPAGAPGGRCGPCCRAGAALRPPLQPLCAGFLRQPVPAVLLAAAVPSAAPPAFLWHLVGVFVTVPPPFRWCRFGVVIFQWKRCFLKRTGSWEAVGCREKHSREGKKKAKPKQVPGKSGLFMALGSSEYLGVTWRGG